MTVQLPVLLQEMVLVRCGVIVCAAAPHNLTDVNVLVFREIEAYENNPTNRITSLILSENI
jgi:hypothetical protein